MTALLRRELLTDALGDWLDVHLTRPVGRLQAPSGRPFPYHVLYAIPGGAFDGPPLTDPDADASVVYQLNSVALSPAESERLADDARAVILGRTGGTFDVPHPELAGWSFMDRRPDAGLPGSEYAGTPPTRVFTTSERFVFDLTPS